MNIFAKFDLAERVEQTFADVYGILAKQFEHEPKYQVLFTRLAQEEIQHAQRIKMLRKRYVSMGKDLKMIEFDVVPLQAGLKNGEALKQRLTSGETFASAAEIVTIIAELERQFANAHTNIIAAVVDPAIRELFEQLAAQDREHAALLLGKD